MIALTFTLTLHEPVLATSLQGDPNSGVSYPFIPGSLIRGAVIGRYLAQSGGTDDDFAANPLTRALFLDGQTRYLPAYLQIDDKRTLPTPAGWYKDKDAQVDKGYVVFDKAHPDFDEEDCELDTPKPEKPAFCLITDETLTLHHPEMHINVHTQRERRTGRATEQDGAVFRYEALAAGQDFAGVILVDDPARVSQLKDLLSGTFFMGGSRSGGYGRVEIGHVQQSSTWTETGVAPTAITAGEVFTLTLLSDLLVRDNDGQVADTLSPELVVQSLGLPVEAIKSTGKAFKQTKLVGGFNRKWGLPIPQTIAVRAGAVFQFKAEVDIPAQAVSDLLVQGVGERRTEGFGRVAINWPGETKLAVGKYTPNVRRLGQPPALTNPVSQDLAQQMNRRLLRRDADLALGKAINDLNLIAPPARSQLGGLRVVIRSALAGQTVQPVLGYLTEMRSAAGNQFKKAKINLPGSAPEEFLTWLNQSLQNPAGVWNKIGFTPNTAPKFIATRLPQTDPALTVEYTLRLIDGVVAKAAKIHYRTLFGMEFM